MSTPQPAAVEMKTMQSLVSQNQAPSPSMSLSALPPPAASNSRWHSRPYFLSINMLQLIASLAVAAFAVVIAGWQSRPNWSWSYLSWYFFALGGLQFVAVVAGIAAAARPMKVVLIGSLFFFTLGTLAVIVTSLLMLIPDFRSSFLSSCFIPFASAEYISTMQVFELQYCVTSTGSASDLGKWAAWCLGLLGTFIQLPWLFYISLHTPGTKVADRPGPLAFNKLPQLDPAMSVALAPTVGVTDTSAGCGILFAPTNQSGTLQVLQLVEGGPAQKCGKIAEGDIISEVDSVAMLGKGLPELLKALAGPPGSIAKLSFMRFVGAEITPYTVSIVREVVRLELSRVGCGVTVRAAPSGFMEISGVEPRVLSSADVRVGDVVLAVDGTVTSDAQALLGPPGTDCRLTLQRGEGAQAARFAVVLKRGGAAVDDAGSVPIEFKPAFEGGLYVVRSDASILGVNTGDCLHTIDLANVFRRPLSEVLPLLRGPVGSFVRLGLRKGSADQLFFVNVQRVSPTSAPFVAAAQPAPFVHVPLPVNQPVSAPKSVPADMNPVDLLQQQLALQRQLETLQQEGRNQMVSLQKSLVGDSIQQPQPIPSALQQQLEFLQKKEQQNQQQSSLQRQDLSKSQSGSVGNSQVGPGSVRSEPSAMKNSGQQQQPVLPIKLFGVGIFFATDASGGQVVRSFVPGGPAERSGQVSIGDVIVSVDNTDVYGLPLATLAKYLLGPRGSTISMGFCKPHDKTGRINRVLITRGASEEDRKLQQQHQQSRAVQQSANADVSADNIATWPNSLLPLGIGVSETSDGLQVVNIIQGSPASQLMGVGESGQRTPLIEISDIIIKVNSLFVPMQAPDSSINRGPLTLSIRKRSGRTLSVIVERDVSLSACVV